MRGVANAHTENLYLHFAKACFDWPLVVGGPTVRLCSSQRYW